MDQIQNPNVQPEANFGEIPKDSRSRKGLIFWLAVLILIVLGIAAVVYLKKGGKLLFLQEKSKTEKQPLKPVVGDQLPAGYKTTVVEKDKYPEGFPEKLVVKGNAMAWQRSEDTVDGSGMRHRVVDLTYKMPQTDIISVYNTSISNSDLGWAIEQESNSLPTFVTVFVKKGVTEDDTQRLVVVCTPSPKGEGVSLVSLQYLTKK